MNECQTGGFGGRQALGNQEARGWRLRFPSLRFLFQKIRREKLLISEKYMVAIKRYPWKGNVRELKNTVKRCLVVTEGEILDYQSLPLQMLEF